MKLNDMFPSRYAKGDDLGGHSFVVTIARIEEAKMRPNPSSPEEERFILFTQEGKKGIILSKYLAQQIARVVGSEDTDAWPGKKIKIYPETIRVAGIQRCVIRAASLDKP